VVIFRNQEGRRAKSVGNSGIA